MASNIGFFGMLHQIYNSVGVLASAIGRGANALDNLGKWAEEQTGTFVDEARIERQSKIEELQRRRIAMAKNDLPLVTEVPADEHPVVTAKVRKAATTA